MARHRGEDQLDTELLEGRWHVGRYWPGMFPALEAACPCPKGPCGLAAPIQAIPCPDHHGAQTLRQGHPAEECGRKKRFRIRMTVRGTEYMK